MSLPHLPSALRVALIALCVGTAGCGGDDSPSDQDQIATAVRLASTSEKIKETCETAVTKRFVREVYGTLAACRKENKPDPDDPDDTAVTTQTRIEDDKATTALTYTIDGTTVATGRVSLVREGDDWKLDRFGVAWLRSAFTGLSKLDDFPATAADCFKRSTRGLSANAVRQAGNALAGSRLDDLPTSVSRCLVDSTLGREALEEGIEDGLREEGLYTKHRMACITGRLRAEVTEDEIARITNKDDFPQSINRKITRAVLKC